MMIASTRSCACVGTPYGTSRTLGWPHLHVGTAEAVDERLIRRRLDDAVELAAIRRDEAHAVDEDVVHLPAPVLAEHPVLEGGLVGTRIDGAALRDDARAHDREVAVDLLGG